MFLSLLSSYCLLVFPIYVAILNKLYVRPTNGNIGQYIRCLWLYVLFSLYNFIYFCCGFSVWPYDYNFVCSSHSYTKEQLNPLVRPTCHLLSNATCPPHHIYNFAPTINAPAYTNTIVAENSLSPLYGSLVYSLLRFAPAASF